VLPRMDKMVAPPYTTFFASATLKSGGAGGRVLSLLAEMFPWLLPKCFSRWCVILSINRLGAVPVTEDQGGTLETHEEVSEVKPDEIIGRRFLKHIGIPSQLERS